MPLLRTTPSCEGTLSTTPARVLAACVAPPHLPLLFLIAFHTSHPECEMKPHSTSGRSTKLIHGGIRYLETAFKKLDIESYYLVEEALEERAYMLQVETRQTDTPPGRLNLLPAKHESL